MSNLSYRGFAVDAETALALLQWQAEMGADEPCLDEPIDRYEEAQIEATARAAEKAARQALAPGGAAPAAPGQVQTQRRMDIGPDHVAEATRLAASANSLAELAEAQQGFQGLDLHKGARNFCFADGIAGARVMVLGEAPGEEEDIQGRPFVGRAGQLLDRMFAAIGLSRSSVDKEAALYITNILPWRPPGNRTPDPTEIAMMLPFVARHVELADPDLLVLMGNTPCQAALGKSGILRLRGNWQTAFGKPTLPMTHPAYLLRTPLAKREAWADLLSLRVKLDAGH